MCLICFNASCSKLFQLKLEQQNYQDRFAERILPWISAGYLFSSNLEGCRKITQLIVA